MKKFVVSLALGLVAMVASVSEASVFGSAYQRVTDARIEIFKGGSWQKVTLGVDIALTGPLNQSSNAVAILGGLPVAVSGSGTSTGTAAVYRGPGAGPADNAGFTPGAIPPGAGSSYSFADTQSLGGSVVNLVAPPPNAPNAGLQLIASTDISSPAVNSFAQGSALLGANITTSFQVLTTANFRFVATILTDLDVVIVPPPLGYQVLAQSFFKATINGTSANGPAGLTFQPGNANVSIVTPFSTNYFNNATYTSTSVALGGGGSYNFDLSSTVNVAAVASIPEPTSMAVFGIMGFGTLVGVRRRKAKVS